MQIPIFFTFDNNYVVPAAVAFFSLLSKAKKDVKYKLYVLHSDITEDNKRLLSDIVNRFEGSELEFIDTNGFLQDEWNNGNFEGHNTRTQFTSDALVKCFGARFFPQYDKIIYSDVDVVFKDDISELFDIDLTDKYIAGVKNAFMKYLKVELSHLKPEHYEMLKDSYLAGGIWVMNLKKIREDNLESKMLEVIKNDTIVKRWPDQDVMNISCRGNVKFLPLNYISYPYLIDILQDKNFVSHFTREELYDSIINPKIIHYAATKPWQDSKMNFASEWLSIFYYLNLPKTKIFSNPNRKNIRKARLKNFLNGIFLSLAQIPFINKLFSQKRKEKLYKSIHKYREIL